MWILSMSKVRHGRTLEEAIESRWCGPNNQTYTSCECVRLESTCPDPHSHNTLDIPASAHSSILCVRPDIFLPLVLEMQRCLF